MGHPRSFGPAAERFCDLVGCAVPLVQAPMAGGWTTPELVAAVSNAGGLGTLAGGLLAPAQLREAIAATRRLSDRPFGVNLLLAPPDPPAPAAGAPAAGTPAAGAPAAGTPAAGAPALLDALARLRAELGLPEPEPSAAAAPPAPPLDELVQVALDAGVRLLSFAMGDPAPWVARCHDAGARVLATATTVAEAVQLDAVGVDAIVVQGAEAGGHRGTFRPAADAPLPLVGGLALIPAVADAVARPLLAAGGVMDGRGLAAALALGAAGVQMGTRFLLASESGAFAAYRERLLRAGDTDTTITWRLTGRPARALANRLLAALDTGERPLPWPQPALLAGDIYRAAVARGDAERAPLLAGQGLALARRVQPAAEVVAEVTAEAARVLRRLAFADDAP